MKIIIVERIHQLSNYHDRLSVEFWMTFLEEECGHKANLCAFTTVFLKEYERMNDLFFKPIDSLDDNSTDPSLFSFVFGLTRLYTIVVRIFSYACP